MPTGRPTAATLTHPGEVDHPPRLDASASGVAQARVTAPSVTPVLGDLETTGDGTGKEFPPVRFNAGLTDLSRALGADGERISPVPIAPSTPQEHQKDSAGGPPSVDELTRKKFGPAGTPFRSRPSLPLHSLVAVPLPRMALRDRPKNRVLGWIGRPPRLPGVLTSAELEREFDRERARVDRNDHCFSVVVFLLGDPSSTAVRRLAKILKDRCRIEDVVGRFDTERLCALLPETDSEGAWILAEDVARLMAESSVHVDCLVHTYPDPAARRRSSARSLAGRDRNGDPSDDVNGDDLRSRSVGGRASAGSITPENHVNGGAPPNSAAAVEQSVAGEDSREARRHAVQGRPVVGLDDFFTLPLPLWKRTLDILVSITLLTLLAPLFALVALGVRLTSPGPIIFRQKRAGRGGRPFLIYKFRSMYVDAEERRAALQSQNELSGPVFKIRKDPRITPIGSFLRRSSIDELPQLWNVLKGDMTLVGPRPPMLNEVADYEPWQLRRLQLTGGLTCIWQVSGRSEIGFEDWVRMDLRYVQRRNFLMDMGLLGRTAKAVFTGRGAY